MNALKGRISTAVADRTRHHQQLDDINATIEEINRLLRKHVQSGYHNSEQDLLQSQINRTKRRNARNSTMAAKILQLQEVAGRCELGIDLDQQRQDLIADRGSVDENGAGYGLLLDLHRDQLTILQLQSILKGWRDLFTEWTDIANELGKLDSRWTNLRTRREKEAAEEATDQTRKLKSIVIKAIVGMFACWAAQWVW
jgi:hypothetical protein